MTSTSDVAADTVRTVESLQGPLLVHCDHQTAGRGQRSNLWQSTPDSLTFTWCVGEQSVNASARSLLPLVAAVAVVETLADLGFDGFEVKWPNDLVFGAHKVGGILVEKINASQTWVLVGIGINVNQSTTAAELKSQTPNQQPTPDAPFPPASVRESTGRAVDLQQLLAAIVDSLFDLICGNSTRDLHASCNQRLAFRGLTVCFETPDGHQFKGKIAGVNKQGHLLLDTDSEQRRFFSGTISTLL